MAKLDFDESLVRRLSELLDETGLTEIEYEAEGLRIRVARESRVVFAPAASMMAGQGEHVASAAEAPAAEAGVPENAVTSPMVGTVYLSPEPGTPSLVKLGDQVEQGQTLVIIEAMKVMNSIPSPRAGKVTRVFVQDGQPVEYGEPLMAIE